MAILDFYVLNLTTLNVKYVWFHLSEVQKQVKWINGNRSQDSGCLGWGWGWVQRVFKKLDIFKLWADRNPLVNLTPIPLQPCPTNLMRLNLRNPIGWKWRRQKCKREIHCLKKRNDWTGEASRWIVRRHSPPLCTVHSTSIAILL